MGEFTESHHSAARISVPQITCQDNLGRILRTKTCDVDGTRLLVDQIFDRYRVQPPPHAQFAFTAEAHIIFPFIIPI